VARLELGLDDGHAGIAVVTLSRRNLLGLLHALDLRGSARTLTKSDCYLSFAPTDRLRLVLRAEGDAHYRRRGESPSPVHPESEGFVREHGGWSPLRG
jgi:hypothetical protein